MSTKIKQSVASALFIGTAALQVAHGQPTELFISEYVEGSSHNKAVEIFNGTGASVDLSSYKLQYYFNGSSSAGRCRWRYLCCCPQFSRSSTNQ